MNDNKLNVYVSALEDIYRNVDRWNSLQISSRIRAALSQPADPQPTPEVGALRKAYDDLLFKVGGTADDYWPDKPSDAPQALEEMREALLHIHRSAALARGSVAEKGER